MDRTTAVLPTTLNSALLRLGKKLEAGGRLDFEMRQVFDEMAGLQPSDVVHLDTQIATAARLCHQTTGTRVLPRLWGVPTHAKQLERTPLLEYLFLSHRDGRLREAALKVISEPIPSAFLAAAICWRLNDWARPVRDAAVACIERCFAVTDPRIIAETLAALMVRRNSWGRWESEREILDRLLAREEVAQSMVLIFARRSTGPTARLLRACLAGPHLDAHLSDIFDSAAQPAVRALALGALLNGEVVWPNGHHEYQWIDKSMGLRRRIVQFGRRPINAATPADGLISAGIVDRSAMVRAVALSGAIKHLRGTEAERDYAVKLQGDRSRSVRDRAKFILEHPDA